MSEEAKPEVLATTAVGIEDAGGRMFLRFAATEGTTEDGREFDAAWAGVKLVVGVRDEERGYRTYVLNLGDAISDVLKLDAERAEADS